MGETYTYITINQKISDKSFMALIIRNKSFRKKLIKPINIAMI